MDEEKEQDAEQLERYLQEIQRLPLLTQEEETQILQRITHSRTERGKSSTDPYIVEDGKQAQHRLITANLPLVVNLARRYMDRGMSLADLVKAGNTGLERATNEFDTTKGYRFNTYATWWVRQAITQAIAHT